MWAALTFLAVVLSAVVAGLSIEALVRPVVWVSSPQSSTILAGGAGGVPLAAALHEVPTTDVRNVVVKFGSEFFPGVSRLTRHGDVRHLHVSLDPKWSLPKYGILFTCADVGMTTDDLPMIQDASVTHRFFSTYEFEGRYSLALVRIHASCEFTMYRARLFASHGSYSAMQVSPWVASPFVEGNGTFAFPSIFMTWVTGTPSPAGVHVVRLPDDPVA